MKLLNTALLNITSILVFLLVFSTSSSGQGKQDLNDAVQGKHFIFLPQTMNPQGGPSRQVTADFDLRLIGDSLVSYLPYFGRAYDVAYSNSNGLNFTSTRFQTDIQTAKDGWRITLHLDDKNSVKEITFDISTSGYGTVQVISQNRQSISFYGSFSPLAP